MTVVATEPMGTRTDRAIHFRLRCSSRSQSRAPSIGRLHTEVRYCNERIAIRFEATVLPWSSSTWYSGRRWDLKPIDLESAEPTKQNESGRCARDPSLRNVSRLRETSPLAGRCGPEEGP
jgi:hypothetical protein